MKATKRVRRTRTELQDLLDRVLTILGEYTERITIRHLFYRLASIGIVAKSEKGYKNLCSHLTKWRRSGSLSMGAFIDSTRWHYGTNGYANATDGMLALARNSYRLNLWQNTEVYAEVWTEKEAVASMVHSVAQEWVLPTFVCRGDSSISSLHDAAVTFRAAEMDGRTPTIIYLGDFDEVGIDIPKKIQENLSKDHGVEVNLLRVAVNEWQIGLWNLPTRPPKGIKRGKAISRAVEVDVLSPSQIRALVTDCIESLVDVNQLEAMRAIEAEEKKTVAHILKATKSRVAAVWEEAGEEMREEDEEDEDDEDDEEEDEEE